MLDEETRERIRQFGAESEARDKRVTKLRAREGIDKMTDDELRANLVTCDFRGEEVKAIVLDELLGRARGKSVGGGIREGKGLMNRGFDYYIGVAREAEGRSQMLWQSVNRYILNVLERAVAEGRTLADAADMLEKSVGKKVKNEPTSLGNIRTAAKRIRAGEELMLL